MTNRMQEGFRRKMRKQYQGQALGIPINSVSMQEEPASVVLSDREKIVNNWMSRLRKKTGTYMYGIRQRVRSGLKKSKTIDGNLSLNSSIIQVGEVERLFEQLFYVEEGEKILKASKCYLSTTAGPIAGIVFISTEKVAFHSDKLIMLSSPEGELHRVPYKVLIPQTRIKGVFLNESTRKPREKYIQIVTMDKFEFWFMRFQNLQHEISEL